MNEYITTIPELIAILKEHDSQDFAGAIKDLEPLVKRIEQPNVVMMIIDEEGQDPTDYIRVMGFTLYYEDKIGIGDLEEYECNKIIWADRNPDMIRTTTWKKHYKEQYTEK